LKSLCTIYVLENKINKKKYIGLTSNSLEQRFKYHVSASNKEYGIDCWEIKSIEEVEFSLASRRERYWIKYHNSLQEGYNSTYGGELGKQIKLYTESEFELDENLISYSLFENLSYFFYNQSKKTIE